MKVVIIEDEKITAKDLANTLVQIDPDVEVLAFLSSVEEAIDYFSAKPQLDLIFSDIELGDGLSFEIFETLAIQTPVIFCTAYDKYSLEAFQSVGIDYILKPFGKAAVEKTLVKFQNLKKQLSAPAPDLSALLSMLKNQMSGASSSIVVYQGDKIIPIHSADIAVFWIEEEYTFALTFDQKKYLVEYNLETLEKKFFPTFFRANRQFLIQRKAVKEAARFFNRKIVVHLTIPFKEQIIVGKLNTAAFVNWLSEH
jgi:DNA-binding LytR/AlgR family response regulator